MSSSSRVRLSSIVFASLLVFSTSLLLAQDQVAPPASQAVVSLGEALFKDVRLSSIGNTSCASCHHPERSFTEDKPVAVGQAGIELARNTPTLLGLSGVAGYPVGGTLLSAPKMVPLEDRVLAPLHDA